MQRALIISPHLDDAALSCASFLKSGAVANVITLLAGVPPTDAALSEWDRLTRATSSRQRVLERRAEDALAWESIGQKYTHLDISEVDIDTLANDVLARALAPFIFDCAELWLPAGIGGHPHHTRARDVALELAAAGTLIRLYGELPYSAFYGWPTDDCNLDVLAYWNSAVSSAGRSGRLFKPSIRELSVEERDWKMRLITHYRTQLPAVSGGTLDLFRNAEYLRYELHFE